jgi:hypothetical protein
MKCEYCHSEKQDGKWCGKCGAILPTTNERLSHPFFYNGYMTYVVRDFSRDIISVYFWLGDRLVEKIEVPERTLCEFIKDGEDYMPFFYELLKVALGENEVLSVKGINDRQSARYEIRKIELPLPDFEYFHSIWEKVAK